MTQSKKPFTFFYDRRQKGQNLQCEIISPFRYYILSYFVLSHPIYDDNIFKNFLDISRFRHQLRLALLYLYTGLLQRIPLRVLTHLVLPVTVGPQSLPPTQKLLPLLFDYLRSLRSTGANSRPQSQPVCINPSMFKLLKLYSWNFRPIGKSKIKKDVPLSDFF